MFKKTKNIDDAFRHIRLFSIVMTLAGTVIICFTIYKSFEKEEQTRERVLILPAGKVIEAVSSNRKDNIQVEARDHVKSFHEYFFDLDPDDKLIEERINKALYLADGSAKREYDNLKESGYYSGIIAGNISQRITVDSVVVDMSSYPYAFRCFASQDIIRTTSTVSRSLITEGLLREVSRSDNNPHGFLIERWRTIDNRDVEIKNR